MQISRNFGKFRLPGRVHGLVVIPGSISGGDVPCNSAWRIKIFHDLEGWAKYLKKTAHFFMPAYKKKILRTILFSAELYSELCENVYVVSSPDFEKSESYVLHFYPQNFLHLTGVKTSLKPADFFFKALNKTLSESDFECGAPNSIEESKRVLYGHVAQKMRHLSKIPTLFSGKDKLYIQENFKKGMIPCCLATANGRFTLGFIGRELCPLTLLNGNLLDSKSLTENISIEIVKIKN